jgi:nicotinate phosphoribosyltransferase
MNTAADQPYLDCAYKLQEYGGVARRKRSEGKATWPGRKQVFRGTDATGRMTGDILSLAEDAQPGAPLLVPAMREGRRLERSPPLAALRERAQAELARLPEALRELGPAPAYPVTVAEPLRALARETDRRVAAGVS